MKPSAPLSRPVIGISAACDGLPEFYEQSLEAMMKMVQRAGGIPLFIGKHSKRNPEDDIKKIDALIVLGNHFDIDPHSYGQPVHPKTVSEMGSDESIARAKYENAILYKALHMGMPLFTVCGGMHRLNVLCGGDLHQHVPDIIRDREKHSVSEGIALHSITVEPETYLYTLATNGNASYRINEASFGEASNHHQAVKRVGSGLRVAARVMDDHPERRLIEAVEADPAGRYKRQFVLGVQWHPEFDVSPLGNKIVKRFVQAGKAFADEHARAHLPHQAESETRLSRQSSVHPSLRTDSPPERSY